MEDSGKRRERAHDLIRIVRGLESNMESLLSMSKNPDFLPEHRQSLESAIKSQVEILNSISKTSGASQLPGKEGIGDFVRGQCKAAKYQLNKFVENWYSTDGKPCLKCDVDKSKCDFCKSLSSAQAD
jgi:hypothetical protein